MSPQGLAFSASIEVLSPLNLFPFSLAQTELQLTPLFPCRSCSLIVHLALHRQLSLTFRTPKQENESHSRQKMSVCKLQHFSTPLKRQKVSGSGRENAMQSERARHLRRQQTAKDKCPQRPCCSPPGRDLPQISTCHNTTKQAKLYLSESGFRNQILEHNSQFLRVYHGPVGLCF